jgi:hypothetical protein
MLPLLVVCYDRATLRVGRWWARESTVYAIVDPEAGGYRLIENYETRALE